MAQVKFFTCTQTQYNTLETKDTGALYFTTDTKRLYKGPVLYGGSLEYVPTLTGVDGAVGTLYYAADTGAISIYDGTAFVTKYLPQSQTLSGESTHGTVPTSKAVYDALDAEATSRSNADTFLSGKINTLNGDADTEGSVAKAVKDAKDLLSGAVGGTFDSTNTVKKYVDDADTALDNYIDYVSGVVEVVNGLSGVEGSFRAGDAALSSAIGGTFDSENTVADAIAALDAAAISISGAANNAIEVTSSGEGNVNKTVGLKIAANDKFLSQTADGLSATFELVKAETLISGDVNAAEYYLADKNGAQVGARINIPKDQFLKSVEFVEGTGSADDKLHFVFTTAGGDVEQDVSLSGLFNEYIEGNGITLTASATGIVIAGKVDSTSEEFLTVGEGGFKLAGVQTAIDTAVNTSGAFLSGAIGSGFDSTNTVKKYVDDAAETLSGQIGSGFGSGTTSGTVAEYINTMVSSEATRADGILSGKLDDVDVNKANEIITAKADGKVQTSGKSIGGSTLAATPDGDTVATEAAVKSYVDNAVTSGLTWQTL